MGVEPRLQSLPGPPQSREAGLSIQPKLNDCTYAVRTPVLHKVRKKTGGIRNTAEFSIPDELVSNRLYSSLIEKNASLFSGSSFAYRPGLIAFDAVQHVRSRWQDADRLFVGEFDFENYFDSIDHEYLHSLFDTLGVYATAQERHLVNEFLNAPLPFEPGQTQTPQKRTVGIPQGTSISLFLANLALTPVDREFERLGVGFVRYADDTLIWSSNYQTVVDALSVLRSWARCSQVAINYKKSRGIRILETHAEAKSEFQSTSYVSFLSYRLGGPHE